MPQRPVSSPVHPLFRTRKRQIHTHGTPYDPNTKDNRYDPLYCTIHAGGDPSLDCNTSQNSQFNYPDDHAWTVQVVTQITSLSADSDSLSAATTTYKYLLAKTQAENGTGCNADSTGDSDCVGDNWLPIDPGNGNKDADWADFYHGEFRGFNYVSTISPSNDLTVDQYYSTEGWHTPEGDASNYNAGAMYQQDIYQGPNATASALLEETDTVYTGFSTNNSCYGVVDLTYVPCQVSPESSKTTLYEGNISGSQPWVETAYTYDDYSPTGNGIGSGYGNVTAETTTSSNASAVTRSYTYTITDSGYNATGWIFYDVNKIAHSEIDDASGHKWQCQSFTYDEGAPAGTPSPAAGWPTTVNTYSSANCTPGSFGAPLTTSYTGYDADGNKVATVDPLAVANSAFYGSSGTSGKNGCTLASAPAIMSTSWGKSNYTTCTTYDTYNAQPVVVANAFSQTTRTQYDYQMGGVPTQVTDANGQNTTMAYLYSSTNGDGEYIQQVGEPGETHGYTFESQNASGCQTTIPINAGPIMPCFEVDTHSEKYNSAIAKTFYDGQGRVVESATPTAEPSGGTGSSSYFTVVLTEYNDSTHSVWKSLPFIYASSSSTIGWLDPNNVLDYTGKAPTGTVTFYDALNRPIGSDDPMLGTSAEPGNLCPSLQQDDASLHLSSYATTTCTIYELDGVSGYNNDSNTYEAIKSIDANLHVMETLQDALGNKRYERYDSGTNTASLMPNELVAYQYNVLNEPTSVTVTDQAPQSGETVTSVTTTMQYDDLGRLTWLVDPDRGTHTYSYDPDGHLLSDVSGTRTLGYNYDLLGRIGCLQNAQPTINATGACSAGSPLIQNTYDISAPGVSWSGSDYPVGRLTQSVSYTDYPDGSSVATTESTQYDTRGRAITAQMALTLPSGWNVTTALPTYQLSQSYNDADQPTTTQTSTIANGQSTPGYTFRQIYDSTTGALIGLANNSTNAADLVTQLLNNNAQLATLNFQTSSNTALASEQFSYDGDLRPVTLNATWSSGSGTSGTIFMQSRSYDPVGNVTSLTTTLAAVPGQTGSGGSETQDFCYDEQNRLVFASNTQAPSPTGSETCGNATPSSGLISGSYSDSFVYTHLGQLWQGPLNDGPTQYQYLYCNPSAHQLSGLYPVGSTCSNKSGAVYKNSSYDGWGNVTGITSGGSSSTLAYDALDRLVKDTIDSNDNEHYAYDASGTRTLRRTVSGGTPTITVYAFGLEEHSYSANGTLQNNTYYYSLNGRLIGELTGLSTQTTNILLTDPLGSVIATFSNTAGSATLSGNQVYGPYGHLRYNAGGLSGMATSKGFTGQYSDAFSGLDYYDSRYYEPAVGIFLSADSKEGNTMGMDPYMYVGGNPQTYNDPTGEYYAPPPQGNGGPPPTCVQLDDCWSGSGGSGHPPTSGNNPPPSRPTSDSPGTSNKPKCGTVCLSNGHRWLDFLGKVVMLLGGGAALVQTIGDLIKWVGIGIASLLQQGWAMVVDAIVHVARDALSALDFIVTFLQIPTGSWMSTIRTVEEVLDFITPIADVGSFLLSFFSTPLKAIAARIFDNNPIINLMAKWGRGAIVKYAVKWAIGQNSAWVEQGIGLVLSGANPGLFCSAISAACENTPPGWVQ